MQFWNFKSLRKCREFYILLTVTFSRKKILHPWKKILIFNRPNYASDICSWTLSNQLSINFLCTFKKKSFFLHTISCVHFKKIFLSPYYFLCTFFFTSLSFYTVGYFCIDRIFCCLFIEPTNMLDMKAIIWLENYLQVCYMILKIVRIVK